MKEKTQSSRGVVRSAVDVKSWLAEMPSVGKARPALCPACNAASIPVGGRVVVQGHGKRSRQAWGPAVPHSPPELRKFDIRRYHCIRCDAVTTVVPCETLTKRLYTAPAIAWALALFGLSLLSPTAIRRLVSPWKIWGVTSAARWQTLLRWAAAAAEGRLFNCVRQMPEGWCARKVAARAASTVGAHALPSPEPPPLDVLTFHGAALAR